MKFVADLHLHSKYSRAVSPKMELSNLAEWAVKKGVDILTTTDFTHPLWFNQIETGLKQIRPGVYQLNKKPSSSTQSPYFILTTEISLVWAGHKMHLIVLAPSIETAKKINQILKRQGFNLSYDGRPIFGISAEKFVEMIKNIDPEINFIPAHIWTPWFSLFGSRSGFDSFKECFDKYGKDIPAIETGLSSDPLMNWQIKDLDTKTIVSFSDAHSLENIGRNATIFELPKDFNYQTLITALKTSYQEGISSKKPHIGLTIEFYPQEGKYHYTGHRKCYVCHSPEDSNKLGTACPVCQRPLTLGVAHQVEKLSRQKRIEPKIKIIKGLKTFFHPNNLHHPFICLTSLRSIISEVEKVGPKSKKVEKKYQLAISQLGNEVSILTKASVGKIKKILGEKIVEGIVKNRQGDVIVEPGYDGIYGKVKIWPDKEKRSVKKQIGLF